MKNLAEFKRSIKVGTKIKVINHTSFDHRNNNGIVVYKDEEKEVREVSIVQSNSFAIKTKHSDGNIVDSWVHFPTAKECKIAENSCTYLIKDTRQINGIIEKGNPNYDNAPIIPFLTIQIA